MGVAIEGRVAVCTLAPDHAATATPSSVITTRGRLAPSPEIPAGGAHPPPASAPRAGAPAAAAAARAAPSHRPSSATVARERSGAREVMPEAHHTARAVARPHAPPHAAAAHDVELLSG